MGFAPICARNAATGSAGALCCGAFQGNAARSEAGKSCARNPLLARVAELRSIARREVGFRREESEDIVSPFDLEMIYRWVVPGTIPHFEMQGLRPVFFFILVRDCQ